MKLAGLREARRAERRARRHFRIMSQIEKDAHAQMLLALKEDRELGIDIRRSLHALRQAKTEAGRAMVKASIYAHGDALFAAAESVAGNSYWTAISDYIASRSEVHPGKNPLRKEGRP